MRYILALSPDSPASSSDSRAGQAPRVLTGVCHHVHFRPGDLYQGILPPGEALTSGEIFDCGLCWQREVVLYIFSGYSEGPIGQVTLPPHPLSQSGSVT